MLNDAKSLLLIGFVAVALLAFTSWNPCLAGDEDPVAYQVKVEMKNGVRMDGVVKDKALLELFKTEKSLEAGQFGEDRKISLYYMNGMSGSMGVNWKDVKKLSSLMGLTRKDLADMEKTIKDRVKQRQETEVVRLAKKKELWEAQQKKKAEEAARRKAQEKEAAVEKALEHRFRWITRYPPEEGWGPEKKEALYHRGVVIGVFPNEEEQTFLDNFAEWQAQLEEWTIMQAELEAARLKEEAEKAAQSKIEGSEKEGSKSVKEKTAGSS